jgi:hypothetical protein
MFTAEKVAAAAPAFLPSLEGRANRERGEAQAVIEGVKRQANDKVGIQGLYFNWIKCCEAHIICL